MAGLTTHVDDQTAITIIVDGGRIEGLLREEQRECRECGGHERSIAFGAGPVFGRDQGEDELVPALAVVGDVPAANGHEPMGLEDLGPEADATDGVHDLLAVVHRAGFRVATFDGKGPGPRGRMAHGHRDMDDRVPERDERVLGLLLLFAGRSDSDGNACGHRASFSRSIRKEQHKKYIT